MVKEIQEHFGYSDEKMESLIRSSQKCLSIALRNARRLEKVSKGQKVDPAEFEFCKGLLDEFKKD